MAVAAETWTGNEEGVDVFLARAASGDDDAVAYLYRRYVPALVHYAQRRGATDAEGVADLAFLDAVNALPSLRSWSEAVFRAYTYQATRSRINGDHRRNTVDTVMLDDDLDVVDPDLIEDAVISQRGFDDLLQGLSPGQRDVIVHRFLGGFSVAETAARLGRTPGAVKQLQFQGLTRIRAAFAVAVVMVLIAGAMVLAQTSQSVVTDAPTGVEENSDEDGNAPVPDVRSADDEQSIREPFSVELEGDKGQLSSSTTTIVESSTSSTSDSPGQEPTGADTDEASRVALVADAASGTADPVAEAASDPKRATIGLSASGALPSSSSVSIPIVVESGGSGDDREDRGDSDDEVAVTTTTTTTTTEPSVSSPSVSLSSKATSTVPRQGDYAEVMLLRNGRSDRCLTTAEEELGNLDCYSYGSQQEFEIVNLSNNTYRITAASGQCIERGGLVDDGAVEVVLTPCRDTEAQAWRVEHLGEGMHKVRSISTNYCLDIDLAGGAMTDRAFARPCDGTSSQRWTFLGV